MMRCLELHPAPPSQHYRHVNGHAVGAECDLLHAKAKAQFHAGTDRFRPGR